MELPSLESTESAGSTILNSVVEEWSYQSSAEPSKKEMALVLSIKFLISLGAKVDSVNYHALTPIYYVLRWGAPGANLEEILELLLTGNPDLNAMSEEGQGLVYLLSSSNRFLPYLQKLANLGLNLEVANKYGAIFAHWAAKSSSESPLLIEETLKFFPEKDHLKYLEHETSMGMTPLHYAAMNGNVSMIEFILKNYPQINLNKISKTSKTALDFAIEIKK